MSDLIHTDGRKRLVLAYAAQGKTIAETAELLGNAESTIAADRAFIIASLAVPNMTAAVAEAIRKGIIT